MDGIINVYKEKGYTSHDVVAKLRGILHMKKIGHTGTLDPDAVGVLPVCLGRGTKLCDMLTDTDKTYEAVMLLGTVTDTQDVTGKVLETHSVAVSEMQVINAVSSFVDGYEQLPPMYSAVKVGGKKLYELARKGVEVERKPRHVEIRSIHINDMDLSPEHPTVTMTVTCSKGTYIRTLCHDIGETLGVGACMESLIRTRVGRFYLDDSYTLAQITALSLKGQVQTIVIPTESMFDYPKAVINHEFEKLLYNGNKLPAESVKEGLPAGMEEASEAGGNFKIYDEAGQFIGVYEFNGSEFVPVKIFFERQ
jgi:tRNA pseudouridine55 synthase